MENWKSVTGYEGIYEVSDLARVRSVDRIAQSALREPQRLKGKILRAAVGGKTGYLTVVLSKDGKTGTRTVHSLVAEAFLGERPDGQVIDHIDGNRTNNLPENLRYVRQAINCRNVTIANSASGVKGVYPNGSGWQAQIIHDGKKLYLGTFRTVQEAEAARANYEQRTDYLQLAGRLGY